MQQLDNLSQSLQMLLSRVDCFPLYAVSIRMFHILAISFTDPHAGNPSAVKRHFRGVAPPCPFRGGKRGGQLPNVITTNPDCNKCSRGSGEVNCAFGTDISERCTQPACGSSWAFSSAARIALPSPVATTILARSAGMKGNTHRVSADHRGVWDWNINQAVPSA